MFPNGSGLFGSARDKPERFEITRCVLEMVCRGAGAATQAVDAPQDLVRLGA